MRRNSVLVIEKHFWPKDIMVCLTLGVKSWGSVTRVETFIFAARFNLPTFLSSVSYLIYVCEAFEKAIELCGVKPAFYAA